MRIILVDTVSGKRRVKVDMAIKEIQITDQDVSYFNKISDAMKDIETRIAALEIAKNSLFKEYEKLQDLYNSFANQLKEKYNIPSLNAEIDIEKKVISFDDEKIN